MSTKKHGNERRSGPKVFRCTGFPDCDMVFTRSEHLARHARKHTGEKPFRCIVPGCSRMFSRFDNMMQHTHTHNQRRKQFSNPTHNTKEKSMIEPRNKRRHTISDKGSQETAYDETLGIQLSRPSIMHNRKLPLPSMETERPLDQAEHFYQQHMYTPSSQSVSPLERGPVDPFHRSLVQTYEPIVLPPFDSRRSSLSLATSPPILPKHEIGDDWHHDTQNWRLSDSTISSRSSFSSQVSHQDSKFVSDGASRRRLSVVDLHTPIFNLQRMNLGEECPEYNYDSAGDDDDGLTRDSSVGAPDINTKTITSDEYEALQGFGKFHSQSVVNKASRDPLAVRKRPSMAESSHNFASKVHAFRQYVLPIRDSFQRTSR